MLRYIIYNLTINYRNIYSVDNVQNNEADNIYIMFVLLYYTIIYTVYINYI